MNEQETRDLLINPYYAVRISPSLTTEHEPMTSKEEWVKANIRLIEEIGSEAWLKRLLDILESPKPVSSVEESSKE